MIEEKPFWLKSPWAILFDIIRLEKLRPWDVKLAYLLNTLLDEIKKKGYIDFTASGIALLSSATIYRMKSESILEMQEPPKPPPEKLVDFIPPAIQLPFRFERPTTTVEHFIKALEDALTSENLISLKPDLIQDLPETVIQKIDEFMVNIDQKIEDLYEKIYLMLNKYEKIQFSILTKGLSRLDVARIFLLILFITCNGRINLWQEEEFGEIHISLPEKEVVTDKADFRDTEYGREEKIIGHD